MGGRIAQPWPSLPMRPPSFTYVVVAMATLIGLASPAWADDDPDETGPTTIDEEADQQARQHFLVGRSYFEQARFEEAAREFSEAHRLSGHAALLVNLAMAYERALEYEAAAEAYERYLDDTDAHAEWAEPARRRAERLREILDRRARAEAEAAAQQPPPSKGLSSKQRWGLAAMGVGLAAGVTALVTGLRANTLHNRLDAACVPNGICPEELQPDITQGRRLSAASWGAFAAAMAASVVGITLVWMGRESTDERPAAELSLGVVPGAAQASLRWRY